MSNQNWLRGRTLIYNVPTPNSETPTTKKFSFLSIPKFIFWLMWKIVKVIALIIGFLVLTFSIIGIWAAVKYTKDSAPVIPDSMVMTLTLDKDYPETTGMSQLLSLIQMDKAPTTLSDVVDSIDRASKDSRVKVLAVKANGGGYNLTQLQSIRDAVLRFKASGKKSVIFSESYGEGGYGLGLYYLATAFDEIWMQPVGNVAIGGINMQIPFFKSIMDKYGVEAQFFQRKEFKNAMEHMTSNQMSSASRLSMESLIGDLAVQLVDPIKASRPKISKSFDELLNLGLLTDRAALESGLIDKLNYEDVMIGAIRKKYAGIQFVSLQKYNAVFRKKQFEHSILDSHYEANIAVIPIEGMIMSGSSKSSPFGMGDKFAGADDIVAAIEEAGQDRNIQTIILRINSPGGSPTASETIHRSVVWARDTMKKKIIVSMGSVAASGGYWVATPSDKIYAMNSTLTGSIGVVGGKINLQGLWNKLDLKWDGVAYGENSGMFSLNTPFTPSEQKQFEATIDNVYEYFIKRVADGRKLKPAQVEQIAKGRAYTGRQALDLGLVDDIGGMDKVLDDLAKVQGLKSRDDLKLVYLPMTDDPMELLMMMLSERVGISPAIEKISASLSPFLGPFSAMRSGAPTRLTYDGYGQLNQ